MLLSFAFGICPPQSSLLVAWAFLAVDLAFVEHTFIRLFRRNLQSHR
jgi:hypothetical protein